MERGLETRETMSTKEEVEEDKEEEEEEEKICRICHSPGDSENPLQYPCACSGSMKFVHPKCLLHWMKQRNTFECEVCKHKCSVYRVYAENTPTRLPLREFVGGISVKACLVLRFCVRFCFSVFHQHLVVPLLAFWMWRLSLASSLSEAKELLVHSHMSPMMNWLYGMVICHVLYMMWLFGIALIREDEEDGEVGAPAPGNENDDIADEIGEDAGEPQAIAGVRNDNNFADLRLLVKGLKLLAARLLRYFHRVMINSLRLDVPLRRTGIYMVGSILYFLITNVVLIRVPFFLGRITLHCLSWLFFEASSIFMPFIESALYIENNSLKNASHAVTNLSAEIQNNDLLSCAIEVVAETLTANSTGPGEALSNVGKPLLVYRSSGLYFVITLATGYMVVAPLVFVCLGIPIRTVASKIHHYLRKFLTTMINSFVLIIHLGVIPLVYGWWLDVCTITMLGKSISDRVEFFSKFPLLSSSMHWVVGIIYMCQINISISQVRRVLHRGVLCFLHDLADPVDIILGVLIDEVQVSQLFSIAVNGILIVFLVYFSRCTGHPVSTNHLPTAYFCT
ncbi:probable E3 ubiquitin ligase SUD1 isoform X1 [Papaver somniferum]|uniref:probable E3 ubiquitin ligase SUD1 isoform X1 n=1 Tax=Papaver somniferum TaxID=3469 RepID=UPI000E70023F|nr:probable E3 ubiquitin ligase SUD1 isoform X1 [Papaver somniferum]